MGLGNFFYAVNCESSTSYSKLKVLNNYFNIIKIFVAGVFLFSLIGLLLCHEYNYLYSLSFLPLGAYLIVKAQVNLGAGNLKASFFAFAMPSFLFCAALLTTYFFKALPIQFVVFLYFLGFNLFFLKKFRLHSIKFLLNNDRLFSLLSAKYQIANGFIVSVLPPLVSLRILDYLKFNFKDNATILMYHLFNRILDATVSFAITYVMALGLTDLDAFRRFLKLPNLLMCLLALIFYFISCNLYLFFVLNRYDFNLTTIEMLNGLVRFCLGLLSVFYITKIPLMITFKEVFITFLVFVSLSILSVGGFTQFQFSILFCYLVSLFILIYYIQIKRI